YWYYYLQQLHLRNIPTLLVSAIFREGSIHFKPWGYMHRQMLKWFTHVFVQDKASADLLAPFIKERTSMAGDTRFDRVLAIKNAPVEVPYIKQYIKNSTTIIAGSTGPADEQLIVQHYKEHKG